MMHNRPSTANSFQIEIMLAQLKMAKKKLTDTLNIRHSCNLIVFELLAAVIYSWYS